MAVKLYAFIQLIGSLHSFEVHLLHDDLSLVECMDLEQSHIDFPMGDGQSSVFTCVSMKQYQQWRLTKVIEGMENE